MSDALVALPGCIGAEPPYLTDDPSCLVGISKSEYRHAILASGIMLRSAEQIVEADTRPGQRFLLYSYAG